MTDIQVIPVSSVPRAKGNAERQREYRARNPERASANKKRYRHNNSKWQTDAAYLSRQFTAWDGEGITREDGSHIYTSLAVLNHDDGDEIENPNGLHTYEILEFITDFAKRHKEKIHVIYGGSYDFNMFLTDLDRDALEKLYRNGSVKWNGFRIQWRRGKSFYIGRLGPTGKTAYGVTIYDVVSFFQMPFVKACDSYLGDEFYKRDLIVTNKAKRGTFTAEDANEVREYNEAELINLIRLMEELRARLNKAGLRPRRWDGPGAVAAALLKREAVQKAQTKCPDPVREAAQYAYAGGRFEVLKFGSVNETAYEYDINSAYPTALRNVPDLTIGEWRYVKGDPGQKPFSMYHVEYRGARHDIPGAFFRRDPNGTVCYPMAVTGWYWSPEVETAREYCERGNGSMRIIGAWVYEYPEHRKPFHFIDKLYKARQEYKKAGDGAHVGIKLGLNSLYGKLAQQVGARKENGEWKIPPFHQLEWAGYTTSFCRAAVLRACLDNLDSVIAFETDAVFTSVPLNVREGTELGDFESVVFDRLTYVQSGVYFGFSEGAPVEKSRGVDKGQMHEADVLAALAIPVAKERAVPASLTRFVGLGVALSQTFSRWQHWEVVTKRVKMEPTGKRIHVGCGCPVDRSTGLTLGHWHDTMCPMLDAAHSSRFPVEWENPDPNMRELAELREQANEWED